MTINRPDDLGDIANLGLTLDQGKLLLAGLQQQIVAGQAKEHAVRRPDCRSCGCVCHVKDYRDHTVATLFGQVTVRLPRFRCAGCGGTEAPMLDWFHIAMRLQHLEQIAGGLSADDPARLAAKAVIVEEVDRLRWRLRNGKAKDAQISIGRIRAVMHHFRGEQGHRKSIAPSRKLWTAWHTLDGYLTGQSDWLVNYAGRHRAGLRVGTAITESTGAPSSCIVPLSGRTAPLMMLMSVDLPAPFSPRRT